MAIERYYLGCPMWANKLWINEIFTAQAKSVDFLSQYASVFTTVEGNTTFYALPKPATVQRWREETPESFRFCLKFPKVISHDKRLIGAERETDYFLELFAPLGKRLGPFFLQLRPAFSGWELDALENFLERLPREFCYAVEVRHRDYFGPAHEEDFDNLLRRFRANRALFDTRGLHASTSTDETVQETKRRKPHVPVRFIATSEQPFVRFIGDPLPEENTPLLEEWADVIAQWIREGKTPYVFIHHAPDDFLAPRTARQLHELLSARIAVGTFPRTPMEKDAPKQDQMSLF